MPKVRARALEETKHNFNVTGQVSRRPVSGRGFTSVWNGFGLEHRKSTDLFAGGCRNTGRGRNPAKHCVEGSSSEQELDEPQCATDSGSEFGEEELCSGWQHVGAAIAESENLAAGLFGA